MSTPPPARCHIGAEWNDGQGADLAPQWSEQNRLSSIVSATWLRRSIGQDAPFLG